MEPTLPPRHSHDNFGEPKSFNDYDMDVAMGGVSTPTSEQCTPQEDTSDEQGFSGDLYTPSHSIENGVSETGYMTDFLRSDLVSPRLAHRMTAMFAAFVDGETPNDLYSTSDILGTHEVNADTYERDLFLRSATPSVQGSVFYILLNITVNVVRYPTSWRLHADSMADGRNDLSR